MLHIIVLACNFLFLLLFCSFHQGMFFSSAILPFLLMNFSGRLYYQLSLQLFSLSFTDQNENPGKRSWGNGVNFFFFFGVLLLCNYLFFQVGDCKVLFLFWYMFL